eukprot:m.143993 g.143993  ORF g.143993 m.143993 type:complete len:190 (-) comp14109_c0_seq7:2704-3273(-)
MLLYVMCAADKYEVTVDDECTVGDLQQVIAEQIDVPVDRQKLLFKGQNLHRTPEKPLKACKVKNKSKLMLIGVAEDPQTIECKQVFGEIAKSLEKYEATLAQVPEDIRGLEHLTRLDDQKKLHQATVRKVKSVNEFLVRHLEQLDALPISQEMLEMRTRRKRIIARIEKLLETGDDLNSTLQDIKATHS